MSTTAQELVTIDYLRLATFDFQVYLKLSQAMRRKCSGWRDSRWLQYKMQTSQDNWRYGIGEQQRKPHGIFEASGVDAHIFWNWLKSKPDELLGALYATRIDLQRTKPGVEGWNYIKAHKSLKDPKELRISPDGSTLYVGNRQSNSFWRVYDKSQGQIRVEIELKGAQAKKALKALLGGVEIHELYNFHLGRSRLPKILVDNYLGGSTPDNEDQLIRALPKDLENTFNWLASLDHMFYKMVNDHDYGDRTEALLRRWLEYATKTGQ